MLELPPKFKQALGNGVRTSLYPLVKIYQGYRIDDTIPDDAESINLSIKETSLDGSAYKPLLLNAPSIRSSADIINNKYTISSVSLSISDAPFQGEIFSNNVRNLLNAVCKIYYCAYGINKIDDCLLVYTGTIRRFNQTAETVNLKLEDLTEQMLSIKIPSSLVPEEPEYYKEEDIGNPYPMVYGFVDKSPLIARSLGQDSMGELRQEITKLHIDKRGKLIKGLWTAPNSENYGHEFLNQSHPLINNGYIGETGALSVYEQNFVPIPQYLDYTQPWSYYVDGITDPDDEAYKKIIFENTDSIYDFYQSNGVDSSASVTINSEAIIDEDDAFGLPTRIYRPIDKVECFTFCDNEQGNNLHAINRIYGFTNYDITSVGNWKPWLKDTGESGNIVSGNSVSSYDNNYNGQGWNNDWWEPTKCNENDMGGETSSIDVNWKRDYGTRGFFPVDRIQDGKTDKGIYICGRNPDGARGGGENYNKTGMGAVKMVYENNLGSFPCSSKFVYDAEYHSFADMDIGHSNHKVAIAASFWTGEQFAHYDGILFQEASFDETLNPYATSYLTESKFPYIPNEDWQDDTNFSNEQSDTQNTVRIINGFGEAKTFNNTTKFDNLKFGIEQYPMQGDDQGNDTSYVSALLFNAYLLHDAIIDQPLGRKFYADVKGRVDDSIINQPLILSAQNILKDILEDELNYKPNNVQMIDDIDTWQHSFTLKEQKEAKEVFEGLFKSSLIIPSFNASGQFTFIPLHQVLDNVQYNLIDNEDILKYSFSLTKIDDVKNSVNVKYKKNYASEEFDKETGYKILDANNNELGETYDEITRFMHPTSGLKWYNIDYYGLKNEEAKLEVETEYIRDELTARKLQKRLLMWYCNQHLIVNLDLPITYINLEVGDYIHINQLLGNKKAFGYDYTKTKLRNGQLVYPLFFINKINKSLDKINIEAVQVHRGEYGQPDEDIIINDDEGTVTDEGGNDGQGNFNWGDPNDNPNYGDDTTIEETPEEEIEPDPSLSISWYNNNNDLNIAPQAIINTNIEGEFQYKVFITNNDEEITHPETEEVLIPVVLENDEPYDASNYINTYINYNYFDDFMIQGGSVMLSTEYEIPWEELSDGTIVSHNGITGILRIFYEGTSFSQDLEFTQNYTEPFVPDLGDVNEDGLINVLDIIMLINAIVYETTEQLPSSADTSGDGDIDILDIIILVNIIIEQSQGIYDFDD